LRRQRISVRLEPGHIRRIDLQAALAHHDTNDTKSTTPDIRTIPMRVRVTSGAAQASRGIIRRIEMRKISLFATALILIVVGAWTMRTTPRVDASTADGVYPLQLTISAKNLPETHYVDSTFVFN
jgi:hypothetical protein